MVVQCVGARAIVVLYGFACKLLIIGVVGRGGDCVDGWSKGEDFVLPDIPAGAYPNSFKGRLRGIVDDTAISDNRYTDTLKLGQRLTMANRDRRVIGFPRTPRDN